MSRLLELTAENALCFDDVRLDLAHQGLCAVLGEKVGSSAQNSNGSGKTSLYELIHFALFNKSLRGSTLDEIVNWNNPKKGAKLQLVFEGKGNRWYGIERYRNHPRHKNKSQLYYNDLDATQPLEQWPTVNWGDKKERELKLQDALGFDREMFEALFLFGIGSTRFSTLGDSGQKKLLEQVLSLSLYAEAATKARKEKEHHESQIEIGESTLEQLKRMEKRSQVQHDLHLERSQEWQRNQGKIEEEQKAKMQKLSEEIQAQKENVQLLNIVGPLDRDEYLQELENVAQAYEALNQRIHQAESRFQERHQHLIQEKTKQSTLYQQYVADRVELEAHQAAGTCPLCGHEADQGLCASKIATLKDNMEQASAIWQKADQDLRALEAAMENVRKENAKEKKALEQKEQIAKDELERVTKAEDAWKVAWHKQKDLEDDLAGLRRIAAKEKREVSNPWTQIVEIALGALEKDRQEVEKKAQELEDSRTEIQLLKVVQKLLGPKGVRSFLFESLVPELNARWLHYSQIVSGGQLVAQISVTSETKNKEIREKISLWVETPSRRAPYNTKSNGEKRRIDLPILFGLQDIAVMRNVSAGLCLLDEVFESVDESGVEGVIQLLREVVMRPHTSTIFAITHNQDLASLFDRHLTVKMENEVSRVVL